MRNIFDIQKTSEVYGIAVVCVLRLVDLETFIVEHPSTRFDLVFFFKFFLNLFSTLSSKF